MASKSLTSGMIQQGQQVILSRKCIPSNKIAVASLKIYKSPPPFKNTKIPDKYKLPLFPKVPTFYALNNVKPPKGMRETWRCMGEELVHNKLMLGQFGIVALAGGLMKHSHFEVLRQDINRMLKPNKSFAIFRVDPPYKPVSVHGIGKKLGGGKGGIHHYVTPVKAGRVICEVAGKVFWEEVEPWLNHTAAKMPFDAIAVSKELMEELDAEEQRLMETNENPYTFEWLIRNNMLDCQKDLSSRDLKWFGKYVYRDRNHNLKWNMIRQKAYKGQ